MRIRERFNPRAPCGARQMTCKLLPACLGFNPRAPCGARRASPYGRYQRGCSFNPRAPCGARHQVTRPKPKPERFQPTRPLRGATVSVQMWYPLKEFQPTRPLRGATHQTQRQKQDCKVSTHAPLAGRDSTPKPEQAIDKKFQPTRPLRGATPLRKISLIRFLRFQPTRPLRGATFAFSAPCFKT